MIGALSAHPEPAVSWPRGFRRGAHARHKTAPIHHVARRRRGVVAARSARAAGSVTEKWGSVLMRKTYGPEYPRTLGALMAWSELDPSGPAVTDSAGTLDRRAFQNRVLCVAAGLRRAGVAPGARVALWLLNGAGYLAAIFGCARVGAIAISNQSRFCIA